MKKIYFAAPLFSRAEQDFNLLVTSVFERKGYKVFLPQRDGYEAAELHNKSADEKTKMIFEKDISEIKNSDIFVMVLDGRVPDDGACVELGFAYATGKRCYGIKTDSRSLELGLDLNPLIAGCFKKIFNNHNWDELLWELTLFLDSQSL